MEIQSKAMRMLRGLKGAGISYKEFSEKTGINLDQIYGRTKRKLTEERAAFYLHAAETHFPEQYKIIKQDIDEVERQFPLMW